MGKDKIIVLIISTALCVTQVSAADTVYLKNGGTIEGIVEKEDGALIEVNIGFGTVTFNKSQIREVKRSSAEDSHNMIRSWEIKRKELEAKEREFQEARDNRFKEAYENWMEDERQKRLREEGLSKEIQIIRDPNTSGIVVETLLNEKVKANLILDTGASIIALSRRVGEELGMDLSNAKKDVMELRLADGRRAMAKAVILDSVKIQDVEVKKVMAAVMLDQAPDPTSKDGLLGMSFLSKFNLKMDLKSMKMSLEKIEK